MPDEPIDPSGEDPPLGLQWPTPGAATPPAPRDRPAGDAPKARATPVRTVRKVEVKADPAARPVAAAPPSAATAPAPDLGPSPDALTALRRREARSPEPLPAPPVPDGAPTGKAFVEAFDRLADRLLDRLRTLRQDVDADLTGVRTELAALRQAVDDLGDRSQLRTLQSTVDELRTELTALRRAVLEWPELEQVSSDIAAVRGDLAFIFESGDGGGVAPPSHLLDELQRTTGTLSDEITRLGAELPQMSALNAVLEEVTAVRSELTQVRRRMVLRSKPLEDEQLEQIVAAVAARVVDSLADADGDSRRKRR